MGDSPSSVDSSGEGSPTGMVNEKGSSRNKRKYLSDLSVETPVDISTPSLTEFPKYETLEEKFQNVLNELGSIMERSESLELQELEGDQQADWDDPVVCQLEELLTNNLFATFCSAVKRIVEYGYTEETAEWAVLNSNLFHGSKDAVSNVADGALALLKRDKAFSIPKHPMFEGLQSLVAYMLLEMIHVLREVRPTVTLAEAMWCLLISDLNLLNACMVEGSPRSAASGEEAPGESPTVSQPKSETSGASQSDSEKFDSSKQIVPGNQSSHSQTPVTGPGHQLPISKPKPGGSAGSGKERSLTPQEAKGKFSGGNREQIQTSSQGVIMDEKAGGSRKGSSSTSKRDMLRQKAFHLEKNYKGRMSKGAFKAKVAAWGSMVLDKSMKSQSGSSSVVVKGMLTTAAGMSSAVVEGNNHPSSNSQSGVPAGTFSVIHPVISLSAVNPKSQAPLVTDPDPSQKGEINVSDLPKPTEYYAVIPFDETLQKYVPQDDKDDSIMTLIPHIKALKKELQGWTDWANDKVMQAARRLGKEQAELKMLRQEKEEAERYKKEKQILEESTMKRLSEMDYALVNATGQIEVANCNVRRLEAENSVLKKHMLAAGIQAQRSACKLHEAIQREQEALKKLQSCDAEKGLLQEQLMDLKRQAAEFDNQLEKAKGRQNQFNNLLKHEEKEKLKAAKQFDILRGKRVEEDDLARAEENNIKQMAAMNIEKCQEDIKNLGNKISELRLESEKSKIAALRVGYGNFVPGENASKNPGLQIPKISKRLAVFQGNFGAENVKPERECVMCMTEEISVVFLPCAHQVLCGQCSALHENQGMNDCPSCRTTIQKRISVTYRVD